ncbi:NAD(P)H-hydrate dehydratase [Oxalobacteraceae bacterium CAVE-383]|nr:NAD(P)H-hydrate dehydratase [Oxalobacteraceae bacterium CAVE-383]
MTDPHTATALYSVAEIRAIEQAALAGLPPYTLMQRAGAAAAAAARRLIPDSQAARILVLAGPGNNGGDALEAACDLSSGGLEVSVLLMAHEQQADDARRALQRAQACAIDWIGFPQLSAGSGTSAAPGWTLVLDGLFGIGLQRALAPEYRAVVAAVNALDCPILALDIASGLNADTGGIVSAPGKGQPGDPAVRATHTISFIGAKPGLHTCDGRDHSGQVQIADLAIDRQFFTAPRVILNTPSGFAASLHPRVQNSHKGSFGDVSIVGGAPGLAGAVILAARAAAHTGAGRVHAGFVDQPPAYDAMHPELMCRAAASLDFGRGAIALGPGLGESREAHDQLSRALHAQANLVLDADALNLLAAEPGLQQKLSTRQRLGAALLTPHPLEAARLLGIDTVAVQADRLHAARALAQRFQAIVILKGSGTVIARPDGFAAVNPTGNPALATAGSGDVLTGICAALLAQHWQPWEAALGAVWLHGAAADYLVEQGVGPIGLCAGELAPAVRQVFNRLIENRPGSRRNGN